MVAVWGMLQFSLVLHVERVTLTYHRNLEAGSDQGLSGITKHTFGVWGQIQTLVSVGLGEIVMEFRFSNYNRVFICPKLRDSWFPPWQGLCQGTFSP